MVRRAALAVLVLAGCASRPSAPSQPGRWDAMSEDAKLAYMTRTVMPETRALFAEHDNARYSRMTCATCHGADGEAKRWKMPNPDLLIEEHDMSAPHARMNAFMKERVVPEMARLLGRPPFDPATKSGFGCLGCHTLDR